MALASQQMEIRDALILSDGRPGHLYQSMGLASALSEAGAISGYSVHELNSPLRGLRRLPQFFMPAARLVREQVRDSKELLSRAVSASVIIDTGSAVIPVSLALGRLFPDIFRIHILSPLCFLLYDMVLVPAHDRKAGNRGNTMNFTCAFNLVSERSMIEDMPRLESRITRKPEQACAVLIGGNSRSYSMDFSVAGIVAALARTGVDFLITTSRRTPDRISNELKRTVRASPGCVMSVFVDEDQFNPLPGLFGYAEKVLVTEDSFSMISESVSSGRPAGIIMSERKQNTKIRRSISEMIRSDLVFPLYKPEDVGRFMNWSPGTPLKDERRVITEEIMSRMRSRGLLPGN